MIVLEGVRSVIREGGGSARFNIRLLSGELGIPVDLVYSTYNINATGIAWLTEVYGYGFLFRYSLLHTKKIKYCN